MSASRTECITYTAPDQPDVRISRLEPDDVTSKMAARCLAICTDALEAQLEPPRGCQLNKGTIRAHFQPDDPVHIQNQVAAISDIAAADDADYWLARRVGSDQVLGYAHFGVTSRQIDLKLIAVDPMLWQQEEDGVARGGVGRYLMHGPLAAGGYGLRQPVFLFGFGGSAVNDWYERIGFTTYGLVRHTSFDESRVLLRGFKTGPGIGAAGVVSRLESRYSALKSHARS